MKPIIMVDRLDPQEDYLKGNRRVLRTARFFIADGIRGRVHMKYNWVPALSTPHGAAFSNRRTYDEIERACAAICEKCGYDGYRIGWASSDFEWGDVSWDGDAITHINHVTFESNDGASVTGDTYQVVYMRDHRTIARFDVPEALENGRAVPSTRVIADRMPSHQRPAFRRSEWVEADGKLVRALTDIVGRSMGHVEATRYLER